MKKILLTLCLLMGYATLHAATATVNGITWTYQVSSGEAYIECSSSTSGAITLPSTLGGYPVTYIGDSVFNGCTALTDIKIPESVTHIGARAFMGCTGLKELTLPPNVGNLGHSAFSGCSNIKEITVHSKSIYLYTAAFTGVTSLEKLTFTGESVSFQPLDYFGGGTFANRKQLKEVHFPQKMKKLEFAMEAFYGCTALEVCELPSVVGEFKLGSNVFTYCSSLKSINLPSTLTSISTGAFQGCTSLTEMTIPESVTGIGASAFKDCTNLREMTLHCKTISLSSSEFEGTVGLERVVFMGESVTLNPYNSVGVFENNKSLKKVIFPSSMKKLILGDCTFRYCSGLTTCELPSSVDELSIGSRCFDCCTSLKSIELPSSLTNLPLLSLAWCTSLTELKLPNALTTIGDRAIEGCRRLTEITIPESVTSIGSRAFEECIGLTKITIPANVTSLGNDAFKNCSALEYVEFLGAPPSGSGNVISTLTTGYYSTEHEAAWAAVWNNKRWRNLQMGLWVPPITFNVTASDGSEVGGVLVEWTEIPNATYTLWRGEKRGEKTTQLASGSLTQYFDETADSSILYHYTVEATMASGVSLYSTQNNGVTASDSGYHDGATLPRIEKVILPAFWLENKAPLAIVWNDYNTRYKVKALKVNLKGPEERSVDLPSDVVTPGSGLIFSALNENFSDADFGMYDVTVTWEVYDETKQVKVKPDSENPFSTKPKKIKVCFNKFGGYTSPNWYNYWPKMGAIAKGYIGDKRIFELVSGNENGGCRYSLLDARVRVNAPEGFPEISTSKASCSYTITNLAPCTKNVVRDENGMIIGGADSEGLKALAQVLSHELRHGELYDEYFNNLGDGVIRIGLPYKRCSFGTIEALTAEMDKKLKSSLSSKEKVYFDYLKEVLAGKYVYDLDGDIVLDHMESGYKTKIGNPDTYQLEKYKDSSYASYGDNEYLAVKAEEKLKVKVNTQKDWAFPGTNCYPEHSGLTKAEWDAEKDKILTAVFGDFEETTSNRSKGLSIQSYSAVALASEEEESLRTGGDLTKLPLLYEITEEGLSIDGEILDQTADYAVGNGYSALAISIPFVNSSGEVISAAEVSGYLVNEKDEPVAFAQTVSDFSTGKTDVLLEFPGDSLQKMKSTTYRLAMVQVVGFQGDLGMTMFSKSEFSNSTFAYTNAQFTGNVANYLYNTFAEEKTQEGLLVEVKGSISTPGVYQLEARLEGADGDLVSHIGYEKEFAAGEMTASFVFPNEEIYLSRQNGPYDICFVRISQDGVILDEHRMAYQTGTYDYADFTPENVCLVVDETSFKRGEDVIGTDGLITNLSFSFDVDYQGEVEEQCQGWLSLYGENDRIVAVSQETFPLVKGRNTLEFLVDGSSIQKSDVDGPYYVKGVLLEPQNGAAETFEPMTTPIELNLEDFGAYPFEVTGNVRFNKHANGYDLVVPLEIMRANTVTVSAMLVDQEERCAATAKVSKTYISPTTEEITLTFINADIAESKLDGPYKVRFIQIQTDVPNIPAASVSLPVCKPTYEITNGEVTITGCTSSVGALEIPATIEGYPVTMISDGAFYECQDLMSITIPSSVTSIGNRAFEGCSGLTSVTIFEGVTTIGDWAFYNCSGLVSVTLPSSVTSIGIDAFRGVAPKILTAAWLPSEMSSVNLKTLIIPKGVTSIVSYAFADCTELTAVTIPEGVTSIGSYAFANCSGLTGVMIPMSVTLIGVRAFYRCQSLTTLVILEGVTSIKDSAFAYCSGLTSVAIPSSVNTIGNYAFYYCTSLTSVTIPSSVTSIGNYAFRGCSGLTSVSIPKGVTSIGSYAFANCSNLASVTLSSSVTSIGNHAFYYCTGLSSVTIPEGVSEIGDSAFERCVSLPSVIIPKGVTRINSRVFAHCDQLVTLIIPESVTEIRDRAIMDCHNLPAITIPAKVTTISDYCFGACYKLKLITIPEEVTTIGEAAFIRCEGLTSIDFEGVPPSTLDSAFSGVSARGYYLPKHAATWKAVLDANGTWNGLTMVQKEMATLPEGLPEATGAWLTDVLEASGITSGRAVLAEGTTVEALEAARLLGITPSVSVSGNIATVAAESTFEVSEVVVAENAVSLAVTITVEAGRFPSEVSLGGAVKLMVCDTLNGEWTEVTPLPTQITLTRMSDTEATLAVTQALDTYKFFKVLVK